MIAERIKYLRKKAGLTQEQLGALVGVGKSNISMYETGVRIPPVDILKKMASIFSVDMNSLFGVETKLVNQPQPTEAAQKLFTLFDQLPPESQEKAIPLIEAALKAVGLLK